jgi:hypothetical protein
MLTVTYITLAAFAAGLILTLVLASLLTPARWWRNPNARAAAILVGGTWAIGSLLLAVGQAPNAAPVLTGEYRTYRSLNVRSSTGTGAVKVAVLPAGTVVTATGVRSGDWWQVRTTIEGRPVSGWASSLWLRRADERF